MSPNPDLGKPHFSYVIKENFSHYREFILQSSATPINFPKGATISQSGTKSPGVYFLLSGIVRISTLNTNGYARILGYHKANTFFAMDAMNPDRKLILTSTAVTPVSALHIPPKTLAAFVRANPDFAFDMLMYCGDLLRLMCHDAESQYGMSVLFKLANFIVLYMQGDNLGTGDFLPLSQYELASAIGVSRIQVARLCAELKKQGHIDIKKRRLYILNPEFFSDYVMGTDG